MTFDHLFEDDDFGYADHTSGSALAHAQYEEAAQDVSQFVGTQAYKLFRKSLEAAIAAQRPDPLRGSDVAACQTFKREGLEMARDILDSTLNAHKEL